MIQSQAIVWSVDHNQGADPQAEIDCPWWFEPAPYEGLEVCQEPELAQDDVDGGEAQ